MILLSVQNRTEKILKVLYISLKNLRCRILIVTVHLLSHFFHRFISFHVLYFSQNIFLFLLFYFLFSYPDKKVSGLLSWKAALKNIPGSFSGTAEKLRNFFRIISCPSKSLMNDFEKIRFWKSILQRHYF